MKMSVNVKNGKSRNPSNFGGFGMVPVVGLEPTRCRHQRILSPSRLPIPSHRHEFSSKSTTPEIGGHFGGQTSKIKNVRFSKAQIFRAVPGSEGEMTKGILSPSRLPFHHTGKVLFIYSTNDRKTQGFFHARRNKPSDKHTDRRRDKGQCDRPGTEMDRSLFLPEIEPRLPGSV